MIIKVLGGGCAKCKELEKVTRKAADELGLDYTIEKVMDFKDIMAYGVMTTPALVVDEQVKLKGRLAKIDEIKELLSNH